MFHKPGFYSHSAAPLSLQSYHMMTKVGRAGQGYDFHFTSKFEGDILQILFCALS